TIVFVEVKARRAHAAAAEAISPAQWRRLHAAASRFLAEAGDPDAACRFDVALVDRSGGIERLENAASFDEWWRRAPQPASLASPPASGEGCIRRPPAKEIPREMVRKARAIRRDRRLRPCDLSAPAPLVRLCRLGADRF